MFFCIWMNPNDNIPFCFTATSAVSDEELRIAEDKFEESKALAEQVDISQIYLKFICFLLQAMATLFDSEAEQIGQLCSFVESQLSFHRQAVDILQQALSSVESMYVRWIEILFSSPFLFNVGEKR